MQEKEQKISAHMDSTSHLGEQATASAAPVSAHTPGPWHVDGRAGSIYAHDIIGPNGEDVGYANASDGADEPTGYPAAANARLIAAAPDLLAACQAFLATQVRDMDEDELVACLQMELAIEKATGTPR